MGRFRNFQEIENDVHSANAITVGAKDRKDKEPSVDSIVAAAIEERKWSDRMRNLFQAIDLDNDGLLSEEEFIHGWDRLHAGKFTKDELRHIFNLADSEGSGNLDYAAFHKLLLESSDFATGVIKIPPFHRDSRGLIQIEPSREKYFGELLRKYNSGRNTEKSLDFSLSRSQNHAMQLYESRIGSLQRFVSMIVMFHQMGHRVERFFANVSFGLLGYRMDRTHSIMRIATTASPVSGADLRQQIYQLRLLKKVKLSVRVISKAWLRYMETKHIRDLAQKISVSVDSANALPTKDAKEHGQNALT